MEAGQRIARLVVQMLRQGPARFQTDLQRTDDLRLVSWHDTLGRFGVEPLQHAMEMLAPSFLGDLFEPAAPLIGPLRSAEKPFRESAQIESRAANQNRSLPTVSEFLKNLSRLALVVTCGVDFRRLANIDHVV